MTVSPGGLITRLDALLDAAPTLAPDLDVSVVVGLRERLAAPLRVAIVGRVKAGKSTLLNALVGERLAPTDAGECTRIVTWYRHGLTRAVTADLTDGSQVSLPFHHTEGRLSVDLDGLERDRIDRLVVNWPSQRLSRLTLIDTPGLRSVDDSAERRTLTFLAGRSNSPVDAVIYLMRHLHRADAEFLDGFRDPSMPDVSPVNTVAVLSRADELGAGRLDAMHTAERVAGRYRSDDRLRALVGDVIPMAGLLAETAATLQDIEAERVRRLAGADAAVLDELLTSVDRFRFGQPLGGHHEEGLLDRLGVFGLKYAISRVRSGESPDGPSLATALAAISGLPRLRTTLVERLENMSDWLKARSALDVLRSAADDLTSSEQSRAVLGEIERIEAGAVELAALGSLQMIASGMVDVGPDASEELARALGSSELWARLGFSGPATVGDLEAAALAAVNRWRAVADHPMSSHLAVEVASTLARVYEGLYVEITS